MLHDTETNTQLCFFIDLVFSIFLFSNHEGVALEIMFFPLSLACQVRNRTCSYLETDNKSLKLWPHLDKLTLLSNLHKSHIDSLNCGHIKISMSRLLFTSLVPLAKKRWSLYFSLEYIICIVVPESIQRKVGMDTHNQKDG